MWIKFDEPKVISSCPKRHRQNVQRLRAKGKSLSHQHHLATACAAIVSSQNGPTFSHRQYVPLFLLVYSKTSCCSNNKQRFHDGGKQQYTSKVKKRQSVQDTPAHFGNWLTDSPEGSPYSFASPDRSGFAYASFVRLLAYPFRIDHYYGQSRPSMHCKSRYTWSAL